MPPVKKTTLEVQIPTDTVDTNKIPSNLLRYLGLAGCFCFVVSYGFMSPFFSWAIFIVGIIMILGVIVGAIYNEGWLDDLLESYS